MLNDQQLATIIVSMAWLLTVDGVSNPQPLAEPSWLGMGTDLEVGRPRDSVYASVANTIVGV